MTGSTRFVPTDEYYERPPSSASRIAAIVARQPRVDGNGRIVATPADPTVTAIVPGLQPGQTPRMADALMAAAAAVGADVTALVDSASFTRTLGAISPADTAGLVGAIQAAMATNPSLAIQPPRQGMQSNPAQGASSGGGTVPPRPKTVAEMIRAQAGLAANQPVPPGSTTY